MQRELSSLPIPPAIRSKLAFAGYSMVDDIINLKPSDLNKELDIGLDAAVDLLRLVREGRHGPPAAQVKNVTAWDLLNDSELQQPIVTFSEQLDQLLGGGIPLGKMTEFCGAPGIGKTQVCLQLAVDVQIPSYFDGNEGQAIYIDTEGSFVVNRLVDMAEAAVAHCQYIAESENNPEQAEAMKSFTVESVLSGVHYFRCLDYTQLIACVRMLDSFVRANRKVKLVILDSIAFHFRHDFDDYLLRSRILNCLAQSFNRLAVTYKLAVVLTNQMTTTFGAGDQSSQLVPALGESWAHIPSQRVILYWSDGQRRATMYKSSSMRELDVGYQITVAGIRDIVHAAAAAIAATTLPTS